MTDNILAIIILPLLVVIAIVAKCLQLISEAIRWVARLFGDQGATVYASGAEEDLLPPQATF